MNAVLKADIADPLLSAGITALTELMQSFAKVDSPTRQRVYHAMQAELPDLVVSLRHDRKLGEYVYRAGWHNAVLRLVLVGLAELR
jgi:hypothetical protein